MNTTCCWTVFLSLFNWSINPAFAQYSNLNTGDMTVIAGAQWEFYQGDCSGQDISSHAVSGLGSTYEDRLLACATLCLDRSNCVAFNYPVPGNGTSLWHHQNCWMKHNPNRQESQYLGETCGLKNQDTYEYYTLIYEQCRLIIHPSLQVSIRLPIQPTIRHSIQRSIHPPIRLLQQVIILQPIRLWCRRLIQLSRHPTTHLVHRLFLQAKHRQTNRQRHQVKRHRIIQRVLRLTHRLVFQPHLQPPPNQHYLPKNQIHLMN